MDTDFSTVKKSKYLIPVLGLLVLLVGLVIGSRLSRQPQRFTPEAAVGTDGAQLSLSGSSNVDVGQPVPVTVNLQAIETPAAGQADGLSTILAVVNFNNTVLSLNASDVSGPISELSYFNAVEDMGGGSSRVIISAYYGQGGEDGYTGAAGGPVALAVLNFSAAAAGTANLSFDGGSSDVSNKQGSPVLNKGSLGNMSVTVSDPQSPTATPTQVVATPAIEPQATATPTTVPGQPTATPEPQATATPVPGAPNSCGGTCGSNANCQSNLVCYANFCRNPLCVASTSCNCPGTTTAPTPTKSTAAAPTTPPGQPTPTIGAVAFAPEATVDPSNPFLAETYESVDFSGTVEVVEEPEPESGNWLLRIINMIVDFITGLFTN